MQSKEKDKIILIRLFPDEDINEKIKEACKLYKVKSAVILSGLGQLKNFQLGYFKENKGYIINKFETPYELLSLTGNICKQDNEFIIHLHAVLSDEKKNVVGGHLFEGKVEITNEIVILKTDISVKRILDEKTGIKGLYLE